MKFTSPVIAAASGSIGGCTWSRNRYGQYLRNRSIPVNPGSVFQDVVRAALGSLSTAWVNELTDAERSAWDTYAAAVPTTDALGNTRFILGLNWYAAINTLRIQAGMARLDAAPVIQTRTSLTPPVLEAGSEASQDLEVSFTNTDEWATAVGGRLFIFVGGPRNATRNFFKGPFRFTTTVNGAVVPPTSPTTFASPFTFAEGQRMYVRTVAMSVDGRISSGTISSVVATA